MDASRENKILGNIRNGKRDAFNELFCFYYPRLLAYTSSIVDRKVAEDITQDVFLYVWENRKRLTITNGFHSYLFQSGYTRCLDYLRKNQSQEKYSSHIMLEHAKQYNELLNEGASALKELYTKDFYRQLYILLEHIPSQRREVFTLAYLHGMKAKEIAATLDIPQRTVESHIYLTLKYLKDKMSPKDFFLLIMLLSGNPEFAYFI